MSAGGRTLVTNGDTGEELEVPSVFTLCPECRGAGSVDHPAFSNGITSDEWNGPEWDDDSREAYIAGAYNITCGRCAGLRVVELPDVARCTFAERRFLVGVRRRQRQEAAWRREEAHERRMGY